MPRGSRSLHTALVVNTLFGPSGLPTGAYDVSEFYDLTTGDPGDWSDSYRCSGDANWTGYCNPRVDAPLTAAATELDPGRRTALYQRADAILSADVPIVPLFQNPEPLVYKSALLGLHGNPGLDGPFWNVQDWRWKS